MKYYIWDIQSNRMFQLNSFQELIEWFASHNGRNLKNKLINNLFEKIALNFNDLRTEVRFDVNLEEYTYIKKQRTIMVLDEYNRIINPKYFEKEILGFKPSKKHTWSRLKKWETYEFRKDPVPHINNKKYMYMFRSPKTTQELRHASDKEIKKYIRPARKKLPNSWDDILRDTFSKSWKNKKIKRQWMKNMK